MGIAFKRKLRNSRCVNMHANAFGISLYERQLPEFQQALNKQYEDIDMTPSYWVDYSYDLDIQKLPAQTVLELGELTIWGQQMPPSQIHVKNIPLSEDNVQLLSPDKHPTLKIMVGDVAIMKFGSSFEEYEQCIKPNTYMEGIFSPNVNEWEGVKSPQLITDTCRFYERKPVFIF